MILNEIFHFVDNDVYFSRSKISNAFKVIQDSLLINEERMRRLGVRSVIFSDVKLFSLIWKR